MVSEKNIQWFKDEIEPLLTNFEIKYKFFPEGDFGALNQVEFNSAKINGVVDFWSLNWLSVFVWDCRKEEEILNVFLEPNQNLEKEAAFEKLKNILNSL